MISASREVAAGIAASQAAGGDDTIESIFLDVVLIWYSSTH
jgi:hypothetical protein